MLEIGPHLPGWAHFFALLPGIIWALVAATVASGLAATAKGIHHAVKTGDMPWDDPATYGAISAGSVPVVGSLLEAAVQEGTGKDPNWGVAGGTTALSLASLGLAEGVAEGGGEAASAATAATVTPAAVEGATKTLEATPQILQAATPAGEATGHAAQYAAQAGNVGAAGEVLTKGTTTGALNVLEEIGSGASDVYDTILQGHKWFGDNIAQPINHALRAPDRVIAGAVGKPAATLIGDTARGAAMGAAQNPKDPLRGAVSGAVGNAVTSGIGASLKGVVPRNVDIGFEAATAKNTPSVGLPHGTTVAESGATGLSPQWEAPRPSDYGFRDLRVDTPMEAGWPNPNGPTTSADGFMGDSRLTATPNPTELQKLAHSSLGGVANIGGTLASSGVSRAMQPTQPGQPNRYMPRSLGEIGPLQRARLYGQQYARPNVRRYYL